MLVSFSVKSKWLLLDRKKLSLLKYNVAGDCLAIKLEGDLKSWTKYFEQIQFWGEIFRTHFQSFFRSKVAFLEFFVHSRSHFKISVDSWSYLFHLFAKGVK